MRLSMRTFLAMLLGMALPMVGCARGVERNEPGPVPNPAPTAVKPGGFSLGGHEAGIPPAPSISAAGDASNVVPAVALEDRASPGVIRQTAGVLEGSVQGIKQGVGKVGQALTPSAPVTPAPDPTLLSTKAKPTPELYQSMARIQEESGRPATADQIYQQALRMWPNHLGMIMNYARFKDRQGQAHDALQWYAKAVKQYPNEPSLANDVGLFYARHGMNNEAMAAYRRAIELQPKRALYRNNLAVLLVDLGQNQQALAELVSVYPEADACYKLGYLLQKKGLTRQATEYFARAVAINPAFPEARMWLDYLHKQPGGGAQVARRVPDNNPAPRSPWQGSPDPQGNNPSAVRPLCPVETPEGRQPEVRQLPPVSRPLPGSGNDAPAPSPEAPSSGARPLPPVSLGRPANRGEIQQTAAQARPAKEEGDRALEDAPLPTAAPLSLAR